MSEQWTSPLSYAPFRYGGSVGPIDISPDRREEIEPAVAGVTRAFGVVGLASADFVVSDDVAWFIEVNPRPGATLDIFDRDEDPLLGRHIEASEGRMTTPVARTAARAAEVVYARSDLACPSADGMAGVGRRPSGRRNEDRRGRSDMHGLRRRRDAEAAKRRVADRAREISAMIEGWTT